ncbi:MAG: patatin-like phospholipase family protein [Pirellulaceae bacterium]
MLERIASLLSMQPLLAGLTPEQIDEVAGRCFLRQLQSAEFLHRAGDKLEAVHLVHNGRLNLLMSTPSGQEQRLLTLGRGSQFGALAILGGELANLVSVVADEPTTLIGIPGEDVLTLGQEMPLLRRNFIRAVGKGVSDKLLSPRLETTDRVFSVHVFDDASRDLLRQVTQRLADLGESTGVLSDQPQGFDNRVEVEPLLDGTDQALSESEVRSTVSRWHEKDRIFLEFGNRVTDAELFAIIEAAGQAWWISSLNSCDQAIARLRTTIGHEVSWQKKSLFIWTLPTEEQVTPWRPELRSLVRRDFKIWLDVSPDATWTQRHSLTRLVHWIRGVQVGLALGGGSARGMAHLGVLQAFETAGVVVDMIAGTSAGVLTGFTYCAGLNPQYAIDQFARDLKPDWYFQKMPGGESLYLLAKYRTRSWDGMLRKYLGDWRLEQAAVPGFSVAADLVSGRQFVRDTGDMVHGILESINLPVLSPPICRDGMALVDGGVLNVLPADVLVNHGCNFVIGVNVASRIKREFAGNRPDTPTEQMKTPGTMKTLLRLLDVLDRNMSAIGAAGADFTIEPDVSAVDPTAFQKTPEIAAAGHAAATASMPAVRTMLHRLDGQLFPP